jgi:RHS repeat-associated protein
VAGNFRPPFDRTPQTLGAIDGLAPQNIVAVLDSSGGITSSIFYDSVDSPLRLERSRLFYYYEVDLAGNVRRIRDINGNDLGGYRYTAFGEEYAADETTPTPTITQPLQWKGRWFNSVAGGIYDVRARQWSPGAGVFLQVDEFERQDARSTLWGWPSQSPPRFVDPSGRDGTDEPNQCIHQVYPDQPDPCASGPTTACRISRCPPDIQQLCDRDGASAYSQCIQGKMAQGQNFSQASIACASVRDGRINSCLDLRCP